MGLASQPTRSAVNLLNVLEPGEEAPDFELPATGGSSLKLSETAARHRATVIAFYVLDFTAG
jgi:peroxiredoxin